MFFIYCGKKENLNATIKMYRFNCPLKKLRNIVSFLIASRLFLSTSSPKNLGDDDITVGLDEWLNHPV